jgi:hypothetical protein
MVDPEYEQYRKKYINFFKIVGVSATAVAIIGSLWSYQYHKDKKEEEYFKQTGFINKGIIGNPDTRRGDAGVSIAIGDMDGDGDLDFITAAPDNIKYFQNVGNKYHPKYVDKGTIGNHLTRWLDSGVGVSLADLDNDGDLDIIVVSPDSIQYIENKNGYSKPTK